METAVAGHIHAVRDGLAIEEKFREAHGQSAEGARIPR